MPENTSDREIVITRVFDAPRELVFDVWTSPKHVGKWWGPNGFSITTSEMSVKTGGVWRYMMHGPDGRNYPNKMVFIEVTKPERLVYHHSDDGEGEVPIEFHTTVTFEDVGGKTKLTMRSIFPTAEGRDRVVREYGAIEGGQQHLARLAEHLQTMADVEFVTTRTVEAPRALVWDAFTKAEHLVHWWGPKGFELHVAKLELQPGGMFLYQMTAASGFNMWARFIYREVTPPERIIYVQSFTDEQGGVVRCPMSDTWPLETLNVLTFTEENGQTTLMLRSTPINATDEERETFRSGHDSMKQGFGSMWDQLVAYLATIQPR